MSKWRIITSRHGTGGAFAPPGDPTLIYSVEEYNPNQYGDNVCSILSLDYALECEWAPAHIRARARSILNNAERTMSEDWLQTVYSHFANCYSPNGKLSTGSDTLVFGTFWGNADKPRPPAEHSQAVLYVRKYFPDHKPRLDLLDRKGMGGQRPCIKCGTRCQYEARIDGWAPFEGSQVCPKGERHDCPLQEATA